MLKIKMWSSIFFWICNWINFGKYYELSEDINWIAGKQTEERFLFAKDFISIRYWDFLGELWS